MGRLTVVLGGTPAIHKLGDIGREKDDLFIVDREEGETLIGRWLEGLGFFDVRVPADRTRKLTRAEADSYHGRIGFIGNTPAGELEIDSSDVEDGWEIDGSEGEEH